MENLLLTEKTERIITITFNRPERRNALSPVLLHEFSALLGELKKEDEVRCVVLRGAGDKAFSSGYDISALPTEVSPELMETLRKTNPLEDALQTIRDFPYPVIAMINGMAFGAGCELAAVCDIRIAAESARLGMPPAKLGLIYMPAGVLRFMNVVGLANAKEIFFTGRYFPAVTGQRDGAGELRGPRRPAGLLHYGDGPGNIGERSSLFERDEGRFQRLPEASENRAGRHEGDRAAGGAGLQQRRSQGRAEGFRGTKEAGFQGTVN